MVRFTWRGRPKEMGLGTPATVSLADAREKAAMARRKVAQGLNPIVLRRDVLLPLASRPLSAPRGAKPNAKLFPVMGALQQALSTAADKFEVLLGYVPALGRPWSRRRLSACGWPARSVPAPKIEYSP